MISFSFFFLRKALNTLKPLFNFAQLDLWQFGSVQGHFVLIVISCAIKVQYKIKKSLNVASVYYNS